jgi:hypothetical protein
VDVAGEVSVHPGEKEPAEWWHSRQEWWRCVGRACTLPAAQTRPARTGPEDWQLPQAGPWAAPSLDSFPDTLTTLPPSMAQWRAGDEEAAQGRLATPLWALSPTGIRGGGGIVHGPAVTARPAIM